MNYLRVILASVYVVLIALLLLCLSDCGGSYAAREDAVERARTIGQDGRLKITLLWDFPGDIDLHVLQPNGTEIYFDKPRDIRTKGFLDVDNRRGGLGSAENVYWQEPPQGQYRVGLVFYKKHYTAPQGGPCTVVIKRVVNGQEKVDTYTVNMTEENMRNVIEVVSFEM